MWDSEALNNVYLFFKFNVNIDLIACRIKFFESRNNYHFLDYKFKNTRIVNLTKEYDCIHLSTSSSFFRLSSIKGKKFEENIFSGEDVKFISNILLIKPIMGVIRESIYYYRKRSDSSSAMQNNDKKKGFYFSTINLVQQYLINKSILLYNYIVPFLQFYIAYETLFRIESPAFNFLDLNDYNKYCNIINNLLKQIDEKYILEQKIFSSRLLIFALSKKYNRDIRYEVILKNECFIYSKYIIINLKYYPNIIYWIFLDIKENNLHLEGEDKLWLPNENYFYFCKLGEKFFFPKYHYYSGNDYVTMYGRINKGRIVIFDIKMEIKEQKDLHFFISYNGKIAEILTSFSLQTHIPAINNSYYIYDNYIIKKINNIIKIYTYNSNLEKELEQEYCIELSSQKKDYLIKYRKTFFEGKKKIETQKKKQIWLINDRKDKAGDNGEYFFRYLQKIQPKEIEFYFIIDKICSDYKRFEKFENIINYNSSEYLNLFLKADKIFSSVSDSWVNNPFGEDGKYITDLYHFEYIYLQNGVIKDDLSGYINRNIKHFDYLITSSKKEYKSFLKPNYGYEKRNLLITGLPRFDNLLQFQKNFIKKKLILIFPTWRIYIRGIRDLVTQKSIKSERFINTTFFNFYNKLINNEQLLDIMEANNYQGIFCLHPNFAAQWTYFNENKIISVKDECNLQKILIESSLLVTDYSNVFFDFGYMLKPIIFTQFDYEEYRNNQYPKGYFDYEKDGFGPICYDIQCTLKSIISEIKNNCKLKNKYFKRIKRFFKYFDDENNKRIYNEFLKDKNIERSHEYFKITKILIIIILIILKIIINIKTN